MPHPSPATLDQLTASGYRYRSVKQEMRENLIARLKDGRELFPGIIGYSKSVVPDVIAAVLSRHDMLFLGLRGQAKTQMIRMLPSLLDEWIPVVAEAHIPDDPLAPATTAAKRILAEKRGDTPIKWLHRSERYNEKLATPDVSIGDLIGEVDIIKHAQGKLLSDEETMHFGLIPRTNRGIFAINELPDLAPRIQVGLFNVLEERDFQIRGYPVRMKLDMCLVFSANPEDYTNRGRIVTPLKDRIGSVIRTHYPSTLSEAMTVSGSRAFLERAYISPAGNTAAALVRLPPVMHQIVEAFIAKARSSPHINQSSGVSVRASITCLENLVSSAEHRALINNETAVMPRACDLPHLVAGARGKIELMLGEDGQGTEDKLILSMIGESVKDVIGKHADPDEFDHIAEQFKSGITLVVGDEVPAAELIAGFKHVDGMLEAAADLAQRLSMDVRDLQSMACAGELLLEFLYVHNRLSKQSGGPGTNAYKG
jgi:magnesium chelatase subunit I